MFFLVIIHSKIKGLASQHSAIIHLTGQPLYTYASFHICQFVLLWESIETLLLVAITYMQTYIHVYVCIYRWFLNMYFSLKITHKLTYKNVQTHE